VQWLRRLQEGESRAECGEAGEREDYCDQRDLDENFPSGKGDRRCGRTEEVCCTTFMAVSGAGVVLQCLAFDVLL
jgi:hypothetical protein